jgi:hypothetical protein
VRQRGVDALGRVGGRAERAGHRVGGRERDPIDLGQRVGILLQERERATAQRLVHARGHRGWNAVLGEQERERAATGVLLPGRHRRLELGLADARYLEQSRARIAVDDLEHLVAMACQQPLGAARADVLDRAQQRDQRIRAGGADLQVLDVELAPEARMLAPRALDLDGVALVQVRDRTRERDLLAVIADGGQHREAAIVRAPTHRDDLSGEGRGLRHPTRVRCEADRP